MMVRQLPSTDKGMPLELYVFTNTVEWLDYEEVMADIFDHLIGAVNYFDLEIFEAPTGNDLREMSFLTPKILSKMEN